MGDTPRFETLVELNDDKSATAARKLSDKELIAACLEGKLWAWEALIERYRSLIFSIPIKYGFSEQDAADIFQATCVKLLEKLPDLHDHEKLRSWFITTVIRQCWRLRKRQRQEPTLTSLTTDNGEEPGWDLAADALPVDERLIEIERKYLIQRAFAQLPERCQELLRYLFFHDPPVSYKEISTALGIAFDSIGPVRGRCLEKFKLLYEREAGAAARIASVKKKRR